MPTRTHDQNELLLGSQNGLCDDCGFKFKQVDLRKKWNGLVVCRDCWEPRHPSDLYAYRSHDNGGGAGSSARSDDDMTGTGTSIAGKPIPPYGDGAIEITTTSLGTVATLVAYSLQLETDITPEAPAVWLITAGALPAGLSMDSSTGLITGTPTASEEVYSLTVKVLDAFGRTDTQDYSGTTSKIYGVACSFAGVDNQPITNTAPDYGPRMHGMKALPNGLYINIGTDSTKASLDPSDVGESWVDIEPYTTTGFKDDSQNWLVDTMDNGILGVLDGIQFWTYDYNTDAWTQRSSIPTANSQQDRSTGVAIRDGLYDFVTYGGQKGISPFYYFNEVWGYSLATDSWTQLNEYAEIEFVWGTAVYLGDNKVFVGGGAFRDFMPDSSIIYNYYIHDLTTDTYEAVTPIPPAYHRPDPMVQYLSGDGDQVILAGQGTNSGISSDDIYVYTISSDTWSVGCGVLTAAASTTNTWRPYILADYRLCMVMSKLSANYKTLVQDSD